MMRRSMPSPWSMISAKKFSAPKMSRNSAAAFLASSYCPSRRRVCTSPDGQPVVAMMPLE